MVGADGEFGLHFHDLRHTGNTLASTAGASTRESMTRMGHSSSRAALIYQHMTSDRDRAIADRLGGHDPRRWGRGSFRLRRHLIWVGRLSVVVSIVERLVPDELWELFQRVVPEAPSRPQGGGRRRHGDREVLAAIVFVATSGCTWQQLPSASFGPSGATAHRRFAEWSKARVWAKLHRLILDELGARGDLDWSRCAIDSVNMRALKRGT
jgi:transposase